MRARLVSKPINGGKQMSKSSAKTKMVYFFGSGKGEGHGKMKELLGGKGANLAEMTNSGVLVPAGFTISTSICHLPPI